MCRCMCRADAARVTTPAGCACTQRQALPGGRSARSERPRRTGQAPPEAPALVRAYRACRRASDGPKDQSGSTELGRGAEWLGTRRELAGALARSQREERCSKSCTRAHGCHSRRQHGSGAAARLKASFNPGASAQRHCVFVVNVSSERRFCPLSGASSAISSGLPLVAHRLPASTPKTHLQIDIITLPAAAPPAAAPPPTPTAAARPPPPVRRQAPWPPAPSTMAQIGRSVWSSRTVSRVTLGQLGQSAARPAPGTHCRRDRPRPRPLTPGRYTPWLPCAGYKRLAVMRRTIKLSAIAQLVYICLRTVWHSVPFLAGGASGPGGGVPRLAGVAAQPGCGTAK